VPNVSFWFNVSGRFKTRMNFETAPSAFFKTMPLFEKTGSFEEGKTTADTILPIFPLFKTCWGFPSVLKSYGIVL
jgi:hypothetical protein